MNSAAQRAFLAALAESQSAMPTLLASIRGEHPAARIAVYRNNARSARDQALSTAFPAVARLLGQDYFSALGEEFSRLHPPRSPVLHEYGGEFAAFIGGFAPLQEFAYLGDLARLEWARRLAFHAADASVAQMDASSSEALAPLVLQPLGWHPSLHVLHSAYPVLQLWRSQVEDAPSPLPDQWHPEALLVWRRGWRVEVQPIQATERELLEYFKSTGAFAGAARTLPREQAQLAASFAILLRLQLLVAAQHIDPPGQDAP